MNTEYLLSEKFLRDFYFFRRPEGLPNKTQLESEVISFSSFKTILKEVLFCGDFLEQNIIFVKESLLRVPIQK